MSSRVRSAYESVRLPEYTGENRCTPCTVVNVAIALVCSAALAALFVPLGVAALVGSLLAIYLRGYLVPGTPALTKRYLPDRVLAWFDKVPEPEPRETDVDVEAFLTGEGIVEPCADVDDLCLTDEFERAWTDRIADLETVEAGELADLLGIEVPITVREYGEAVAFHLDDEGHGHRVGQWESHAALVADAAAASVLDGWTDDWSRLAGEARGEVLYGIRIFVESCPDCGGAVTLEEDTVESCCRSYEVAAATCDDCGARLLESRLE